MSSAAAQPMRVAALIVAAGRGARAGQDGPKQYARLGGSSVLARTLRAFLAHPAVDGLQVVIHAEDGDAYRRVMAELGAPADGIAPPAFGAETRQGSVLAGLEALAAGSAWDVVLIHDAARPFVTAEVIDRAIAAARTEGAAIPVVPLADTVKRVAADGRVVETLPRAELRAVQTPQAFAFDAIFAAHRAAAAAGRADLTDDGAVIEWAGGRLASFAGAPRNGKLTTAEDFAMAEAWLAAEAHLTVRVATGYDVHAFTEGDHVWLGGVRIPHTKGVEAHSDGDVVLHALTDAILGALSDGDIGTHFPPSDPAWRGASSDRFLAFACERLRARGGVLDFLDVSLVCERPKVGPYRGAIVARIAQIAGVRADQVALKATTSEKLGFIGREEGLAALATVTLRLPARD